MSQDLVLAFIPLFVAVDVIGIMPIFVGITQHLKKAQKQRIIVQSLLTALCVSLGFIFLGKAIFKMLGITISDFMIAGGSILFCIAVLDILTAQKQRRVPGEDLGAVPIGTPLIAGPAVLTTSLMLIDQYGIRVTVLAIVFNLVIVGVAFYFSDILLRLLGHSGARALSKIMALLLGAIAVKRSAMGILQIIGASF